MPEFKMAPPEFAYLEGKLLRGGIPPHHVKRTVNELQHHYLDLYEAAMNSGISAEQAKQEALATLGEEKDLVKQMLSEKHLRTWSSRYPWAIYGLGPLFLATLVSTAPIGVFESLVILSEDMTIYLMPDWMQNSLIQSLINGVFFLASYIMPLIIMGCMWLQISKRRDSLVWPVVGATLLCVAAASYNVDINWPDLSGSHIFLSGDFNFKTMLIRTIVNVALVAGFVAYSFRRYGFFEKLADR